LVFMAAIPLAFGLARIYPWAEPDSTIRATMSPSKAWYLSQGFFLIRAASYFVCWMLAVAVLRSSLRFDVIPGGTLAMRRAGAIALLLLVPSTTFAAFDWGMSLEPTWYSSIYGAILTAGGVVVAHSLTVLLLAGPTPAP